MLYEKMEQGVPVLSNFTMVFTPNAYAQYSAKVSSLTMNKVCCDRKKMKMLKDASLGYHFNCLRTCTFSWLY